MNTKYKDSVIVDEHDLPIGHMQMPEAYAQGKILRVSRVLVFDSTGKMLIQKRSKNVMAPLKWNEAASGHVDVDESYRSTAVKELMEEVSIKVHASELEQVDYFFHEELHPNISAKRFNTIYSVVYDGEIVLNGEEVVDARWIDIAELKSDLQFQPDKYTLGFQEVMRRYLAKD